jgi:pantoate--beta-alanine ligase
MQTVVDIEKMKILVERLKEKGKSIGFVPTMGFLHEGHLSLVKQSLAKSDVTVVSIFVNPSQFGPNEDFRDYPRDFEKDSLLLSEMGIDILFAPREEQMYPSGYQTYVQVEHLQDRLCGKSRPKHFKGVCTVVLKLFNIIQPNLAFFGQKDAQQAAILKKMVDDLDLDVELNILPIVREKDGLALSSRNLYLNPEERRAARVLSAGLEEARKRIEAGERETEFIIDKIRQIIQSEELAKIDYVEIVDSKSLCPLKRIKDQILIALAVYIGKTRLIDNLIIQVKE